MKDSIIQITRPGVDTWIWRAIQKPVSWILQWVSVDSACETLLLVGTVLVIVGELDAKLMGFVIGLWMSYLVTGYFTARRWAKIRSRIGDQLTLEYVTAVVSFAAIRWVLTAAWLASAGVLASVGGWIGSIGLVVLSIQMYVLTVVDMRSRKHIRLPSLRRAHQLAPAGTPA